MLALSVAFLSDMPGKAVPGERTDKGSIPIRTLALTAHDPILIDGNAGFTSPNTSTGVTRGSGTESDPYVIEGWEISSFPSSGTEIRDADVHFVIQDCYVNGGTTYLSKAIYLFNCSNGTIRNCTCSSNEGEAICLESSAGSNIVNNNCSCNGWVDIYVSDSSNSSLNGNTCSWSDGDDVGISIYRSNNLSLMNNDCSGNEYGFRILESDDVSLADNNCSSNIYNGIELEDCDNAILLNNSCFWDGEYGICLKGCTNATFLENLLVGDGVFIMGDDVDHSASHSIDTTNTANGKPIYYFKNQNGFTVPAGAGQVLMANCTDAHIGNQILDDASVGIGLAFCTGTIVFNNSCSNNYEGIRLFHSDANFLIGNNCSNNGAGIRLWGSGNTLINNVCTSNSGAGIFLGWGSSGNSLFNNTFIHNNGATDTYDASHIQGYDDGTDNWWNSTDGYGNYWSDWTTPDTSPADGIVDSPYDIAGSAGAKDNCPLTVQNLPDLEVRSEETSIYATPSTVVVYTQALLSANVYNVGDVTVVGVPVSFFDGAALVGSTTTGSIWKDTFDVVSVYWTPTTTGLHTVRVVVNNGNAGPHDPVEIDYANNEATRVFDVLTLPNLVVSDLEFVPVNSVPGGDLLTVRATLTNTEYTPVTSTLVALYRDSPTGMLLMTQDISVTLIRNSTVVTFAYQTPVVIGNLAMTLCIVANPAHTLAELMYIDNLVIGTITILDMRPDLAVSSSWIAVGASGDLASSTVGETVKIEAMIANFGGNPVHEFSVTIGVRNTVTLYNYTLETFICNISADPLNHTVNVSCEWTIPAGSEGTNEIWVYVDNDFMISETSETNNFAFRAIQITVPEAIPEFAMMPLVAIGLMAMVMVAVETRRRKVE